MSAASDDRRDFTREQSDRLDARLLASGRIDEVFARHLPDLQTRARLRFGAQGEDAVQATMLRVFSEWKAGKTYPIPIRAVLHKVLDWTMREMWAKPKFDYLSEGWDPPDPHAPDEFIDVEDRALIESLAARLPDRSRQVIQARYLQGLEFEMIATELGITRNAVDQAHLRALRELKEIVGHG